MRRDWRNTRYISPQLCKDKSGKDAHDKLCCAGQHCDGRKSHSLDPVSVQVYEAEKQIGPRINEQI